MTSLRFRHIISGSIVRLLDSHLTGSPRLFPKRSPPQPLGWSSFRWFEARSCNPAPRGRPSSLVQQGCFQAAITAPLPRRRGAQSSA